MVLQKRILGLRLCLVPRATPPEDLGAQLRAAGVHRWPVILSPERPVPLPRSWRLCKPRTLSIWEISKGDASLRAALHQKWRNQLCKAERANLQIKLCPLPAKTDGPVLRTASHQAAQRGYQLWPDRLTAAFAKVAPHQTHLFQAHHRGREIAHMLFLSHGNTATYHIGHITEDGKDRAAHNLILWQAALHFKTQGVRTIDLGMLDPRTPTLNRFKRRTGARQQQTGGTHLYWHPWG